MGKQFTGKDARTLVRDMMVGVYNKSLKDLRLPGSDNPDFVAHLIFMLTKMKHPVLSGGLATSATDVVNATIKFSPDIDAHEGVYSAAVNFLCEKQIPKFPLEAILDYAPDDDEFFALAELSLRLDLGREVLNLVNEFDSGSEDYLVMEALAKYLGLELPKNSQACDQDNQDCTCEPEEGEGRDGEGSGEDPE